MKLAVPTILGVLVATTGCVRVIEIENQDAHVTSVGTVEFDGRFNVVIEYTILDPEGDDQDVRIDVCEGADRDCGVAIAGLGGDPTTRLPTVPEGTDVLHEFRWNPWCGRYVATDLVETDTTTEYVASVRIVGTESDPLFSNPFTLEGLGASEERDCE